MANTDKNLVITPNIGSSSDDPKIVFSAASSTLGPQNITLRAYPTNNGTLSFEGSSGQLFSLSNTMTGTLFAVNDVSGMPSIEVLDTGLIKLGQFGGNVAIGSGIDNPYKLDVYNASSYYQLRIRSAGDPLMKFSGQYNSGNGAEIWQNSSGQVYFNINSLNTGFFINSAPYSEFYGSVRAPIYYEAGSTTHYLNLNGDSSFSGQLYIGGWFRNNNANEGLYNQSTGGHLYTHAAQIWNVAGNTDASAISLRWVSTHNGTVRGQLRGDGEWFGFMNRNDEFALRHRQTDGYSPNWWFLENGNETWTGDTGSDEGKIEYHANRFYMVAGTNSDRIVQFRRGGSDKSYIDNDGVFVGNVSGNASTAYGLNVHTGRNNEANKVVRTDGSGYAQFGWINTDSGNHGTTTPDRIYASNDGYIRYYTPANFLTVMNISTFAKAFVLAG
jgi:hypothetical protein